MFSVYCKFQEKGEIKHLGVKSKNRRKLKRMIFLSILKNSIKKDKECIGFT